MPDTRVVNKDEPITGGCLCKKIKFLSSIFFKLTNRESTSFFSLLYDEISIASTFFWPKFNAYLYFFLKIEYGIS